MRNERGYEGRIEGVYGFKPPPRNSGKNFFALKLCNTFNFSILTSLIHEESFGLFFSLLCLLKETTCCGVKLSLLVIA